MATHQQLIIIGGGAAGFFAAIRCAELLPGADVTILEKSHRCLAKVRISGGGRCNVTHACFEPRQLVDYYPRGRSHLHGLFHRFGPADTVAWFKERGISLKTEQDGRMFPVTDNSQTIVDCLYKAAVDAGVKIEMNQGVESLQQLEKGFQLRMTSGAHRYADKILIASGGSPTVKGLEWLRLLGLEIVSPVPSLFSFNMRFENRNEMMGCSVQKVQVSLAGHSLRVEGPLLFTHWGMSGPAILRLSSEAAPYLAEKGYHFAITIRWIEGFNEETLREELQQVRNTQSIRQAGTRPLFDLPRRLWEFLLRRAGVDPNQQWAQLAKKNLNALVQVLLRDAYSVEGKTTFKEEFVTCGGVSLDEVDLKTMEAKKIKGLFFAGEVLDIDGITGGFNFQAAWSTGYVAAGGMVQQV